MPPTFDVAAEHARLAARLRAAADALDPSRRLAVPDASREVLGLHKTQLLSVLREWRKAHAGVAERDLLALFEALWSAVTREEQMLATRLLALRPAAVPGVEWREIERWRRQVDSLETGDAFAVHVLGPWVLHDVPGRLDRVRVMLQSGDLMDRRLALIVSVWLNRGRQGETHPEVTVEFVDRVVDDREPAVMDAASWALRALARHHRDIVEEYLATRDRLAPLVRGEVLNWLATGTKKGLGVQPWLIPGDSTPRDNGA